MSRVTFHSPSGSVDLRGSERAHMGLLVSDLAYAVFRPWGYLGYETLSRVAPGRYTLADDRGNFAERFRLTLAIGSDEYFPVPGGPRVFDVCLNTALAIGSDAVRLMARLHAQCEIHAWVDGPNRAWLAGLIDDGRRAGVMREGQGWEGVASFLRERNDEPVVTSYSVTDSFPSPAAAGYSDDRDNDGWYDFSEAVRWNMAMSALRETGRGLELAPERWAYPDYWFGTTKDTAFTITELAHKLAEEKR